MFRSVPWLLVFAATFSACGPAGCNLTSHGFLNADGGVCHVSPIRFDRFLVQSDDAATLRFGLDQQCHEDLQALGVARPKVTVQLTAPDGTPAEHTDSMVVHSQPGTTHYQDVLSISFTPNQAGTWTLQANFEPDVGVTVQKIEVARLRTDARVRVIEWKVPQSCVQFEATDHDTALCFSRGTSVEPASLLTSRGERLNGVGFALAGDSLWRLATHDRDAGVERLEDDGSAFVSSAWVATAWAAAGQLVIDGDGAWLFGSTSADPAVSRGPLALLEVRPAPGGELAITSAPISVSGSYTGGIAVGDGGVMVWREGNPTAPLTIIHADGSASDVTTLADQSIVGAGPDAIWVSAYAEDNPSTFENDLEVLRLEAGQAVRARLELPHQTFIDFGNVGPPLIPAQQQQPGTDFEGLAFFPKLEGGKVWIERFVAGAGYDPVNAASDRHAFALRSDRAAIKVFDR